MANTTNFGWETPDDTDLVKDGAAAMRTLGNSIDASFVDLKGGTTGQVLSKNSNTDLDFTWVAQDDSNAIQNSIVDAKADLITATANDTPARLAVGNNGENLVADSSATTGLRWQSNFAAGKNKVINGDFGIWQRGTSFSPASATGVYLADRFNCYVEGSGTTRTISQQTFTAGTAPVAGYEGRFFLRYAQSVGPSAGIGNNLFRQLVESVRTFAGQTVTFSFWAKAASTMTIELIDLIQDMGTGGSPSSNTQTVLATNVSIGTSWTRYTYTATLPSLSGKTLGTNNNDNLAIRLNLPLSAGATFTFDTWGWQLEAGNTATAFQTATGTLAGELAAAMRYYFRFNADADQLVINSGFANSGTTASGRIQFPVPMRTTPTSLDSANLKFGNYAGSGYAMSSIGFNQTSNIGAQVYGTVSGATAGHAGAVLGNTNGAYVGFSAEL